MKLKVTVNDVAYDVDVDVDKTPNAPMAPILFGGGAGGPMKGTCSPPSAPPFRLTWATTERFRPSVSPRVSPGSVRDAGLSRTIRFVDLEKLT